MNPRLIVTSELNEDLTTEGEYWLVIGPFCWGKSRSLPVALENAASGLSYGEGTFTACIIPEGNLVIENDGSYRVDGWTPEQQKRASDNSRKVAVTKGAAKRWKDNGSAHLKKHRQLLKKKA